MEHRTKRFRQLGFLESAKCAQDLQPIINKAYTSLLESGVEVSVPPGPIQSVAVGPIENDLDIEGLAEALRKCVRGDDEKWRGHKLKFAAIIMQVGELE